MCWSTHPATSWVRVGEEVEQRFGAQVVDTESSALFRSWDCQAGTTDTRPASVAG